jgi:hypothetical protein
MLIGVAYLVVLSARDPQRILDTGRVFLEEEEIAPAAAGE